METTIAVRESTVQLLTQLKRKLEAKSLDETIVKVMARMEKIPTSRFGSQPLLKKFSEEERGTSREL